MQIRDLDAALGAEVLAIELAAPLLKAEVTAIESVWRERLVVVFHGQSLSDPQLIAFSENFGELDPPGPNPYGEPFNKAHPEVNIISNVVENGKPIGNLGDGEAVWHADMTYSMCRPKPRCCTRSRFHARSRVAIPISPTCLRPSRPYPEN